jgi:acyl-coenzyme A thioesterase PaaI-like protein
MPPSAAVLSVEFKINLLAPATGDSIIARGRVIKPGRTISVCWGEVFALTGGEEKLVATMVGTMMTVEGRGLTD